MIQGSLGVAAAFGAALLWSATTAAAPGNATVNVNMRIGPSTQYSVITTIPAGAPIQVFECESWCRVGYAGTYGFVSANYVVGGYTEPAPRDFYRLAPDHGSPSVGVRRSHTWHLAPSQDWRHHRAHFRRGDGAYFEFDL